MFFNHHYFVPHSSLLNIIDELSKSKFGGGIWLRFLRVSGQVQAGAGVGRRGIFTIFLFFSAGGGNSFILIEERKIYPYGRLRRFLSNRRFKTAGQPAEDVRTTRPT
jgi:hypothetical protein